MEKDRKKLHAAVVAVALAAFSLSTMAWCVNCELAFEHASGAKSLVLSRITPSWLYGAFSVVAVDLSTVSTFLPMLLTGFVAWAMLRRHRQPDKPLPWWVSSDQVPFFRGFAPFCFWSGLGGTLYGLIIGLPAGDVALHDALSNLILGFKTSIFSSLSGLVCAGLSVPISAIFSRYVFPREQPPSLGETIDALRRDFDRFRDTINDTVAPFQQLAELIGIMSVDIEGCAKQIRNVGQTVKVEWFQDVVQQLLNANSDLSDMNATSRSQLDLANRVHEFLQTKCNEAEMRDDTRARAQSEQHEEIRVVISSLVNAMRLDRESLGHGLCEIGRNLVPRNGESRKGARL